MPKQSLIKILWKNYVLISSKVAVLLLKTSFFKAHVFISTIPENVLGLLKPSLHATHN